jgi:hypothetical protein
MLRPKKLEIRKNMKTVKEAIKTKQRAMKLSQIRKRDWQLFLKQKWVEEIRSVIQIITSNIKNLSNSTRNLVLWNWNIKDDRITHIQRSKLVGTGFNQTGISLRKYLCSWPGLPTIRWNSHGYLYYRTCLHILYKPEFI